MGMFDVVDVSVDYMKVRPQIYDLVGLPQPAILAELSKDPGQLFAEMSGLTLMLTPYCNVRCKHCCVGYENFLTDHRYPIMAEEAALAAIELIPKAQQFTNSGGEVWLLDKEVRDYAHKQGYVGKGLMGRLQGVDYLERLVRRQSERLRDDWDAVSQDYFSHEERFLRMPTNGIMLPWLEGVDLADKQALRGSDLYRAFYRFRGMLFQLSIGPFQQWEYLRLGHGREDRTLLRRVQEVLAVHGVVSQDLNKDYGVSQPPNFSVGFMFTSTRPKLKSDQAKAAELERLDQDLAQRYHMQGITIPENAFPTHDRDRCPIVALLEDAGITIEFQPTLLVGNAKKNGLPRADPGFHARPGSVVDEIDELYCVPIGDGRTLKFFSNTVHYYANHDEPLFVLRLK